MPNPVHDPKYTIFRELLVAARLDRKMMQSEIAEQLGKTQSYVSKYERGERRLDMPEFVELAQVLQIDVAEFVKTYSALVAAQRAKH